MLRYIYILFTFFTRAVNSSPTKLAKIIHITHFTELFLLCHDITPQIYQILRISSLHPTPPQLEVMQELGTFYSLPMSTPFFTSWLCWYRQE